MIDTKELDTELEKFVLHDFQDDFKLDRFFKLISIKQALVQIKQAEAQTKMFESMANMQSKIDPNTVNELLKNNSLQDLMNKFS